MIKEINPKFTALMQGNIAHLTDAQLFIDHAMEKIRDIAVDSADGVDTLHIDRIDKAFPLNFVIYELLNSVYGFKSDVVAGLCRSLEHGNSGKRFYSKEYVAHVDRGNVIISRITEEDDCETTVEADAMRSFCGNSVLYYVHTDIDQIKTFGVPENMAQIDADLLKYPLRLRRWRNGDWFIPFGMTGRKKVGDFLTDCKTSAIEKQRQFVLLSGDDIVWVVGRRIDDRYRLTEKSENVLKIIRETI